MPKCNVCSRQFKTVGALNQHRNDTGHGGAAAPKKQQPSRPKGVSNPRKVTAPRSGVNEVTVPLRKREFVFTVEVTTKNGHIAGYWDFGIRDRSRDTAIPILTKMGAMFQNYRLRSCKLEFVPYASAMQGGSFTLGVDHDSNTATPSSRSAIFSMPCFTTAVHKPASINVVCDASVERFTHNRDKARDYPFSIRYSTDIPPVANATDSDKIAIGDIWITYDVLLYGLDAN